MAFLGLGSFGTGLVTGFAESANKALQEDMDRINRRIDTISEYRVKKAIAEQEERAAEVKEVQDLIKQGSKLFKDNPRATEYAATLLDKYGIDGYKALLPKMQEAQFNNGLNISNYFDIAQVSDVTTGTAKPLTINDYAEAYIGGNVKVPDYKLPAEAMPDAGLIGAIFGDVDISGRIQKRYESDIAAAGYDMDIEVPAVTLGDITFDKFKFDVDTAATFDDRVKLYQDKLSDINLSEDEVLKTEKGFDALLSTAANSRSRDSQTKALYLQLDRSNPGSEKAQSIVQQIANIRRDDRLERAIAMGDEGLGDVLQIEAEQAWAKYKANPTDENLQAFKDKKNEQNLFSTGRGISLNDQLQDIQSQMMGIEDRNSPAYLALEEQAKKIRRVGDAGLTATVNQYASADALVRQEAENLSLANPIVTSQPYIDSKRLLEQGFTLSRLMEVNADAYAAYQAANQVILSNREQAFNNLITTMPDDIGLRAYGVANGLVEQPSVTVTPTGDLPVPVPSDATDTTVPTVDDQTSQAIPTDMKPTPVTDVQITETQAGEEPEMIEVDKTKDSFVITDEKGEDKTVNVGEVEFEIKDGGRVIGVDRRTPTREEVENMLKVYPTTTRGPNNGVSKYLRDIQLELRKEENTKTFQDFYSDAVAFGYPQEWLDKLMSEAKRQDAGHRALKTVNYVPFLSLPESPVPEEGVM